MKKIFFFLFLLINIYSQEKDVIASFDDIKILRQDFEDKYNFIPHLEKDTNDDSLKYNFLYSVLAEKLLSKEALEKNLDTSMVYRSVIPQIEKMFIRDKFYQKIVENVTIPADQIKEGLKRRKLNYRINIVSSKDKSFLLSIIKEIKQKTNVDSVFVKYFGKVQTPFDITFGTLESYDLENKIFALKEGEVTEPLLNKQLWSIYILREINKAEYNSTSVKVEVLKIVKERNEKYFGNKYLNSLLSNYKIIIDKELFTSLANKIYLYIKNDTTNEQKIKINSKSINEIYFSFNENELKKEISGIPGTITTLSDFLFYLTQEDVSFTKNNKKVLYQELKSIIDLYIERELIAKEAYKQGIQYLPEVKKDIQERKDNILSQLMKNYLIDSLLVDADNNYSVHTFEILLNDLDKAEEILNQLNSGTDFQFLAKQYSLRKGIINGDLGYLDRNMFGEIGKTALRLKNGDVYGPFKNEDGYSIIKVTDRKKLNNSKSSDITLNDKINQYIGNIASNKNIKINQTEMFKITFLKMQNIVFRYMGFGPRITAVPLTFPQSDWVKYVNKEKL